MKKIISLIIALFVLLTLTGCSGCETDPGGFAFSSPTTYDEAIVRLPDGEFVRGRLTYWTKDNDLIWVNIDEITYFTSIVNVVLIRRGE